jgi:hypothetical protein
MSNNRIIELLVTPLENNIKSLEANLENERRISQKRITELEEKLQATKDELKACREANDQTQG